MIRELSLALGLVLVASAADSGDYELRTPTESIKAKSAQACTDAQRAIARGWIKSIPPGTATECIPHPSFFTPAENCIRGFNCSARNPQP
jgi:hypothetical protein